MARAIDIVDIVDTVYVVNQTAVTSPTDLNRPISKLIYMYMYSVGSMYMYIYIGNVVVH